MADTGPTTLSLFSGVGGLDLGWTAATGGRLVGLAERDSYAAATLLARMEDESMEPAPIWCGDICELPLAPFHGVEAIIGGFPCQDISVAGKGEGIEGEQSGLWGRAFVPAICELRPRFVFVENVRALVTRGLDTVLGDLAGLGYDTEWTSLRASAVGAPHQRERVFILAYADQHGRACERERRLREDGHAQRRHDANGRGSAPPTVADSRSRGQHPRAGSTASGVQLEEPELGCALFPPGPDERDAWAAILAEQPQLAPALEPGFRVLVDGTPMVVDESRVDALRCAGNGVVALQAAVAARLLLRRMM